jgi:hypothetical protein
MDYEVTTYRNADPIAHVDQFANGDKQAKRGGKEVCLAGEPAGDWWWHINDGHLDVGPFASEEAAFADALDTLARFGAVSVAYKGRKAA